MILKSSNMNTLKKAIIMLSAALVVWSCSNNDDPMDSGSSASISLSVSTLQVDKGGGNATVTITSSGDWRLSGVSEWAHPSTTSGKNGDVVTFTVSPNSGEEVRIATFKFFTGTAVVPLTVESAPGYSLNLLSEKEVSVSSTQNSIKVLLNTNIAEPTITCSEDWLTFDRRVDFAGETSFLFNAVGNTGYKDRNATITIASSLVENPITVRVTQAQTDAIIPEKESFINDLSARTLSFTLKYNIDYSVSITKGSDWITEEHISDPQQSEDGLSTVTLTYKLNEATATRGGEITIKGSQLDTKVTIIQKDPTAEVIRILDEQLFALLLRNGWIMDLGNSQCVVLEKGQNATILMNSSYSITLTDLSGIENFPNLTSLSLGTCTKMKEMDISGLHKVSSLSYRSLRNCEEINLGDNPIKSFNAGGVYNYFYNESLKIISTQLETASLNLYSAYEDWDKITSIDVSECPALKTLNADRGAKVKTLYLKKGQVIPDLTKNDATEIVYKD